MGSTVAQLDSKKKQGYLDSRLISGRAIALSPVNTLRAAPASFILLNLQYHCAPEGHNYLQSGLGAKCSRISMDRIAHVFPAFGVNA
jgi:hypothetical protein